MTAAAVRTALPRLTPGASVVAHYTLRDCLGRRSGERNIVGKLVKVDRVSPTVFRARIRRYDGLHYEIDSRIGEVTPA